MQPAERTTNVRARLFVAHAHEPLTRAKASRRVGQLQRTSVLQTPTTIHAKEPTIVSDEDDVFTKAVAPSSGRTVELRSYTLLSHT